MCFSELFMITTVIRIWLSNKKLFGDLRIFLNCLVCFGITDFVENKYLLSEVVFNNMKNMRWAQFNLYLKRILVHAFSIVNTEYTKLYDSMLTPSIKSTLYLVLFVTNMNGIFNMCCHLPVRMSLLNQRHWWCHLSEN